MFIKDYGLEWGFSYFQHIGQCLAKTATYGPRFLSVLGPGEGCPRRFSLTGGVDVTHVLCPGLSKAQCLDTSAVVKLPTVVCRRIQSAV